MRAQRVGERKKDVAGSIQPACDRRSIDVGFSTADPGVRPNERPHSHPWVFLESREPVGMMRVCSGLWQ